MEVRIFDFFPAVFAQLPATGSGMGGMAFYLLCFIPPMLLAAYAQGLVKSRYASASRRPAQMSGAAAARMILNSAGLQHVEIRMTQGFLSDHYDPRSKTVNLSPDVYQGQTLAAIGIAAHEVGHAIQDGTHYPLMVIRQLAVPMASIGSSAAIWILVAGLVLKITGLAMVGVFLFGGVALFQIINLPVEYNASARAKKQLAALGVINGEELNVVRKVLGAAALTYVAATLAAFLQFLYFASLVFGRRN